MNPGPQDGRRRRNHGAMAATILIVVGNIFYICNLKGTSYSSFPSTSNNVHLGTNCCSLKCNLDTSHPLTSNDVCLGTRPARHQQRTSTHVLQPCRRFNLTGFTSRPWWRPQQPRPRPHPRHPTWSFPNPPFVTQKLPDCRLIPVSKTGSGWTRICWPGYFPFIRTKLGMIFWKG